MKCGQCKEGRMHERFFPWKSNVALVMKCTLLLWPVAAFLLARPDYYQCDHCGHKKGALWVK